MIEKRSQFLMDGYGFGMQFEGRRQVAPKDDRDANVKSFGDGWTWQAVIRAARSTLTRC